jgi:hypothetical protein
VNNPVDLDDIRKGMDAIADLVVQWIQYIRDPRGSAIRLLAEVEPEQSRIRRAMGIWVISFVLSLLILTPVYSSVGIGFKNFEFQLVAFLFLTGTLICAGACMHIGFNRYGIRSKFGDTLLVYTVFFGCYSPLFNLLGYPYLYAIFGALRQAKAEHLGLYDTPVRVFSSLQSSAASVRIVGPVGSMLINLAAILLIGAFAGTIADYYGTTRKQILLSLSFSMSILAQVPVFLMTFLYYLVVYTYSS